MQTFFIILLIGLCPVIQVIRRAVMMKYRNQSSYKNQLSKKKLVEFDELFEAHNQILLKMVAALIQSTY